MVRRRLTALQWIQALQALPKAYWTVADLEKISKLSRPSLYVTIARLAKAGVIRRLTNGVYQFGDRAEAVEVAMQQRYQPSYLSFESALSRYGVLSQMSYVLTFATTRPSKQIRWGQTAAAFRRLQPRLFFGYRREGNLMVAEPEKALLDALYLMSKGWLVLPLKELSLNGLDRGKLKRDARRFPPAVKRSLDQLVK